MNITNNMPLLYNEDCYKILNNNIEDETIDLVITSPPYNDLRQYGGIIDTWDENKFKSIANELYRVLKHGGVIVWVVNDKTEKGSKTLTSFKQTLYFKEIGFNVNDVMIWRKLNIMPVIKQPRYNPCFEYMIILSKGKPKTFNPIMRPCKCAGLHYTSTVKNIGGENGRRKIDYHVNKETVDYNIWDIAVAKNKETIVIDGKEIRHPAVFPYEIPYRHILSWSNEGDTVLDPFMGSGTTGLACKNTNRNFIGIELNTNYFELAKSKLGLK